jgi:hypothetical protein
MGFRMSVWELRPGAANDHAPVVSLDTGDIVSGKFEANGTAKDWMSRPHVQFEVEPRKKVQRAAADVSMFFPGSIVLSQEARAALGGFLTRFGQLLELDVQGQVRYFYNVTHVVDCIDDERTTRTKDGSLKKVAFDLSKVPEEACVFKAPLTARFQLYVNDAAKKLLEQWARDAQLTGFEIGKPNVI